MDDFDILNRASFDDTQKTYTVTVPPCIIEGTGTLDLGGPTNVFWIKHVGWKYDYIDVNFPGARVTTIKRIKVSVGDVLQDADRALPPFEQPKAHVGKINFKVVNTNLENNHKLVVEFFIRGVLVKPKPGTEPLPLKMMLAYIMMDPTSRGRLALQEAAADELNQTLTQLGLGSIRDILPKGLSAISSLPPPIQMMVLQGLASKGQLPESVASSFLPMLGGGINQNSKAPLALPDLDPDKEESAFMGDFLATIPDDFDVKREHLRRIAEAMIERGWRRI